MTIVLITAECIKYPFGLNIKNTSIQIEQGEYAASISILLNLFKHGDNRIINVEDYFTLTGEVVAEVDGGLKFFFILTSGIKYLNCAGLMRYNNRNPMLSALIAGTCVNYNTNHIKSASIHIHQIICFKLSKRTTFKQSLLILSKQSFWVNLREQIVNLIHLSLCRIVRVSETALNVAIHEIASLRSIELYAAECPLEYIKQSFKLQIIKSFFRDGLNEVQFAYHTCD